MNKIRTIAVRLDEELHRRLCDAAAEADVTVSVYIRHYLCCEFGYWPGGRLGE